VRTNLVKNALSPSVVLFRRVVVINELSFLIFTHTALQMTMTTKATIRLARESFSAM
jgi:hypothetical protein